MSPQHILTELLGGLTWYPVSGGYLLTSIKPAVFGHTEDEAVRKALATLQEHFAEQAAETWLAYCNTSALAAHLADVGRDVPISELRHMINSPGQHPAREHAALLALIARIHETLNP